MIEKFRFNKITIILVILSILSFTPSIIQANSHLGIKLPKLKFEICLVYPVCSFYILDESRKNATMSGFHHDKIVVRMEPLVNMSYIRQCTKEILGVGNFREIIWIDFAKKMSEAESISARGKKFRGMLLGDIVIDNQRSRDVVIRLIADYCAAGGS